MGRHELDGDGCLSAIQMQRFVVDWRDRLRTDRWPNENMKQATAGHKRGRQLEIPRVKACRGDHVRTCRLFGCMMNDGKSDTSRSISWIAESPKVKYSMRGKLSIDGR